MFEEILDTLYLLAIFSIRKSRPASTAIKPYEHESKLHLPCTPTEKECSIEAHGTGCGDYSS